MTVRSSSNRAWLAVCGFALLSIAAPQARAQSSADWMLHPEHPCVQDPVILYVRAFNSTPCDSFIFAGRVGESQVLIRTLVHEGIYCFAAPIPYAIPIEFGRLPVGAKTIEVRHRSLVLHQDGTLDSTTTDATVSFDVSLVCVPVSTMPAAQLPFVDSVTTAPTHPCPEHPTTIAMLGHFPNGCGRLVSAGDDNGRLHVVVDPDGYGGGCPDILLRWQAYLPLGFLQAGSHHVAIDYTVLGTNTRWPPILDQSYIGTFDFQVTTPCDTLPDLLPYVSSIRVGPDSSAICAGRPIPVEIAGAFPDDCFSLRRVELIDMTLSPLPAPPIVRLIVDDGGCLGRVCAPGPVPWSTTVMLPGLPLGAYGLRVEVARTTCSDSFPPGELFSTSVPFQVTDTCGVVPRPCLMGHWQRPADEQECNAFIGPGNHYTAELTFEVMTSVALSGLQGELNFREFGLMIGDIQTTGPAAGMRLSWVRADNGARFVMFADQGAPIPANPAVPTPVLLVTVVPMPVPVPLDDRIVASGGLPPYFRLAAERLLGSDIDAQEVLDCSQFPDPAMHPPPALPIAVICVDQPCDFNGDGLGDVRDLVLMVRCVNGTGPCPADPATHFDCNGDHQFALSDVMCCAVRLLSGGGCPGCPVDSVRASSGQVVLGDAVATEAGFDVTVRVTQPGELGAAALEIQFPTDRYMLTGVDLDQSEWLELHWPTASGVSLGLIRIQPTVRLDLSPLQAVLHLELQPGKTPAGQVRLVSGDFSANDGIKLGVTVGEDARALGGPISMSISRARPNPFTGETRFTVSLDGGARLEVGVFDVGGRRVAQLFRGPKGPGAHAFVWNGRRDDGTAAGEGIYFYRVAGAGRTLTGKVALLRSP